MNDLFDFLPPAPKVKMAAYPYYNKAFKHLKKKQPPILPIFEVNMFETKEKDFPPLKFEDHSHSTKYS